MSAGTLLTQLMAKALNRALSNVPVSGFGVVGGRVAETVEGSIKEVDANDTAIMLAYAEKVLIVPGYGMAVAQAQHKSSEMSELLEERGVPYARSCECPTGRGRRSL